MSANIQKLLPPLNQDGSLTSPDNPPNSFHNYPSVLTTIPHNVHTHIPPTVSAVQQPNLPNATTSAPTNVSTNFPSSSLPEHPTSSRAPSHSGGNNAQKVHAARCTLMMRELLLELTAMAQEHAVYSPQKLFNFHFTEEQLGKSESNSNTKQ